MVGWSGLGIYAAFCAAGGCLHFQFGSRKRLLAANAAAATPPTTAGPQAQVQATSTAVTTALPQLPHLNLSLPAKFSTASTLLAGGALLVARQSKNAVQTAGWGLATLLFLPLNLTGVEVLPPTLFGSLIPPAVRKLGTFLCVSSATVVGLVALRRFHSDSTAFVLVSALGSVPLALEVGDYVLCHREVVEKRLRATVERWTSGDAGTLTCLDSYLNDLIASLLNQRSDNRTGPFNAAAVKKICREEHRKHAVELRQALGDDLRAEGSVFVKSAAAFFDEGVCCAAHFLDLRRGSQLLLILVVVVCQIAREHSDTWRTYGRAADWGDSPVISVRRRHFRCCEQARGTAQQH